MIYLLISDLDKGSFSGDCEQKYYWTLCTKKPGKNMRCKGVALLHRHAEKWDGKLSLKKNAIMTQMNTDREKLLMLERKGKVSK